MFPVFLLSTETWTDPHGWFGARELGAVRGDRRLAPAEGAELAALADDRVQEAQSVEQHAPLLRLDALDLVLVHHNRVRAHQSSAEASRRLVGHLRRHLQQAEREGGRGARRDEEAEVVEENIAQLLAMGLCPQGSEQARAALEAGGGDLSAAVALLCDA